MKLNKKQVGLIAGVVCVILLLVLLLTMCSAEKEPAAPGTTAAATESTVSATETAAETEETTAPTEEATEETTEETEETTEATVPVTGGNNSSSGSNTATTPTVPETIPDPGSEGSPYYEFVGEVAEAEAIDSVAIPVNGVIYYNLDVAEASILTIADADAYVIYQEKKYEADNGVVALTLAAARDEAPVLVQIGNNNAEEKSFALTFSHALGAAQNPDVLVAGDTVENGKWSKDITVALAPGNAKGYHYLYTATEKGTLTLTVDSVTGTEEEDSDDQIEALADSLGVEISVTIGETTTKSVDGTVSVEVNENDVAMIQIIASEVDGDYPGLEAVVKYSFTYPEGTEKNPICVNDLTSVQIQNLASNGMLYFRADNLNGVTLKIKDTIKVFIQIGDKKISAVNGLTSEAITTDGEIVFAVGNESEGAKSFELLLEYPVGSRLKPDTKITYSSRTTNDTVTAESYYYQYTATRDGIYTFELISASNGWVYSMTNLTSGETTGVHKSTDAEIISTHSIGADPNDKILIIVGSVNGEETEISFKFKRSNKDTSAVSDIVLQPGENELTPVSTAQTTVYKFTPGKVGTYIFETDKGTLSYWGSSLEAMANATAEESGMLTYTVANAEETVLIGVTGAVKCKLNIMEEVVYGEDKVVSQFALNLLENEKIAALDLTQTYDLVLDAQTGCYRIGENGPVVLVDLSNDAFVNLLKYMENTELYGNLTDAQGNPIKEVYNALLLKYAANSAVIPVDETEKKTLYPLTEELMYILKRAGEQLGWYDNSSAGYLFGTAADLNQESLWMFCCNTVQTEVVTLDETGNESGTEPDNESGSEPGNEAENEPGEEPGNEPGVEPGEEPGEEPGTE